MSTATGTPVFVTVGGDASAATATYTASGATTSTTVTLSNLAETVASNTTAVAEAATNAATAVSTANTAATNAASASTLAGSAVQTSQANTASGYLQIGSNGCSATLGQESLAANAGLTIGNQGADYQSFVNFYSGTTAGGTDNDSKIFATGGTGNLDGDIGVWTSGAFRPWNNNQTALGTSNNYWSGIVSESAVQVISDANDKTIVGTIGASDYTAETTKLRAAWAAISGVVYTLNLSTNATKRNHIGVIAQTVQSAFTAQGLDPSDYGLWCSTPKTKTVTSTVDGKTVYTTEPVYESDGKTQATQQTVRYEELLSLGIFCERLERSDLAARVTALEAKSTASTTA